MHLVVSTLSATLELANDSLGQMMVRLVELSRAQGLLTGRLVDVGLARRDQARLGALTEDIVKTSAIEGELLNVESVRSSIARRLGVYIAALAPMDRHVEGRRRDGAGCNLALRCTAYRIAPVRMTCGAVL